MSKFTNFPNVEYYNVADPPQMKTDGGEANSRNVFLIDAADDLQFVDGLRFGSAPAEAISNLREAQL